MSKQVAATAENSKGHNRPAVLTASDLVRDFGYIDTSLTETEQLFKDCPPVCEDEEDLEIMRSAVKRFQGVHKRLEAIRVEAKDPYLAATRVVDSHFNVRKTKVEGWQTDVESRAERFLKKKEAEERAVREETARRVAEEARIAVEEARQAEQERIDAEQTRLAEAFAGSSLVPEAHHEQRASTARVEETTLRTVAIQKSAEAIKAQVAATAKPAELARTRTGTGLSTLAEVWEFEIENLADVDFNQLREQIPLADLEKAISRFVGIHKGDRPLKGVRIYSDTKVRMT